MTAKSNARPLVDHTDQCPPCEQLPKDGAACFKKG